MRLMTTYPRLCRGLGVISACATALALAFAPVRAHAESVSVNGVGTATVTAVAHLNFSIAVPKFLFLQVGTGTSMANNTAVDQITFTVPAANVGDSAAIAGTGGNAGGGTATTVVVKGNNGQVTITETNNGTGGLSNGAGNVISYNEIQATSSTGGLPAPVLSNGSSNTSLPSLSGKVTNQSANWTYSYLNTTTPAAGTYGTSTNGGRVTYTATMP